MFCIAKALGVSTSDVAEKHINWSIGPDSKLPIATLRERLDGSCSLMRKSKCTVQKLKPVVCALFPIGRMYMMQTDEYRYFTQPSGCLGATGGTEHTVREWLADFDIEKRDAMSKAWHKLFTSASMCMRRMKHLSEDDARSYHNFLVITLYLNYPVEVPFIEAVQKNAELLQKALPRFKMPDFEEKSGND